MDNFESQTPNFNHNQPPAPTPTSQSPGIETNESPDEHSDTESGLMKIVKLLCNQEKINPALEHDNADDFVSSTVFSPQRFKQYRFVVAMLVITADLFMVISGYLVVGDNGFRAGWAFFTTWAMALLTVDVCVSFWIMYKEPASVQEGKALPVRLKAHWVLYYLSSNANFLSAFGFWMFVFPYLDRKLWAVSCLLIPAHGLNIIYHVINVVIVRTPIRIEHLYIPLILSISYACFTGVYYALGGTGLYEHTYIYKVIDYESQLGRAVAFDIIFGLASPVVSHAFYWLAAQARQVIFTRRPTHRYEDRRRSVLTIDRY